LAYFRSVNKQSAAAFFLFLRFAALRFCEANELGSAPAKSGKGEMAA